MDSYDVECPYCAWPQDIDHDGGYGYQENETFEQECSSCGKTFVYRTTMWFEYKVKTAACLYGVKHDLVATKTWLVGNTKMECRACGARFQPGPADWRVIRNEYYDIR